MSRSLGKYVLALPVLCSWLLVGMIEAKAAEIKESTPNNAGTATALTPTVLTTQEETLTPVEEPSIADPTLNNEEAAQEQVTSVSQLSDVRPSDWAFQALQSLIERYGVIAGYSDQTFRGDRSLSRYEFAAGLNAALDRINELIAGNNDLVKTEDLETIKKLQNEFASELAQLRGRLDALEARTTTLEQNQFSTTTKLQGTVQFVVGGVLAGNNVITKQPAPRTITFQDQARLVLNTSFTGKDQLRLTLSGGNIESLGMTRSGIFGTFDGRTADNRSPRFQPNQVI
ncbi:MAG TPA: iron uptake porin, partial [Nostocaceae cyanobacterium]|nr:iron uptake porin [Nostocaceae cyanobacterium]